MTSEQLKDLEDKLWQAADKLRVDSGLKASEYATPILGLIFLRFVTLQPHCTRIKSRTGSSERKPYAKKGIGDCHI